MGSSPNSQRNRCHLHIFPGLMALFFLLCLSTDVSAVMYHWTDINEDKQNRTDRGFGVAVYLSVDIYVTVAACTTDQD